jgi:hypothetical protein
MRRTLKKIAIKQQRKEGKRNLVKSLKLVKKQLRDSAKRGKLTLRYQHLDNYYEIFIVLRYLRIHSDLKFEFYGSNSSEYIDSCAVSWD